MNPRLQDRPARSPIAEGLSLLPYFWLQQRMHRRRWAGALAATAVLAGAAWWLARSRPNPGS